MALIEKIATGGEGRRWDAAADDGAVAAVAAAVDDGGGLELAAANDTAFPGHVDAAIVDDVVDFAVVDYDCDGTNESGDC